MCVYVVSHGSHSFLFLDTTIILRDPLNLLDGADEERFNRLRYVEIKHGRICMLGVLGYLTTAGGVRLRGRAAALESSGRTPCGGAAAGIFRPQWRWQCPTGAGNRPGSNYNAKPCSLYVILFYDCFC